MLTNPSVSAHTRSAYSLTDVFRSVLHQVGNEVCADELHAVLGLGLMVCAATDESTPEVWSAYARDAFLVETGRLYGTTIRPIHPPTAARGLNGRAEFRQHFEASYAPLVERALEHGQSVLVWGGWCDPHSRDWGLITNTNAGGLGFCGSVYQDAIPSSSATSREPATLILQSPPAQVYVVEASTGERPSAPELVSSIMAHTRSALRGAIDEAFGVVTGVRAVDRWLRHLEADTGSESSSFLGSLAVSALSLKRTLAKNTARNVPPASTVVVACEAIAARTGDADSDLRATGGAVREILEELTAA